jgi:RNA polymerase sigma factor (sigma-70 family)
MEAATDLAINSHTVVDNGSDIPGQRAKLEAIRQRWQKGFSPDEIADDIDGLVEAYQTDKTDQAKAEILSILSGYLVDITLDAETGNPLATYNRTQQAVIQQVEDLPADSEEELLDRLIEVAVTVANGTSDTGQASGQPTGNGVGPASGAVSNRSKQYFEIPEGQSPDGPFPPDMRMRDLQSSRADLITKRRAFTEIMVDYELDITKYARFSVRQLPDANSLTYDIVQETFLRLWTRSDQFTHKPDHPNSLKAWLLKITLNLARDAYRASKKKEIPFPEAIALAADPHTGERRDVAFENPHRSDDPLDILERRVSISELSSLPSMTPKSFEALILRDLFGYSPPEIAERLETTEASIHGLVHRSRKAIRSNDEVRREYQIIAKDDDGED